MQPCSKEVRRHWVKREKKGLYPTLTPELVLNDADDRNVQRGGHELQLDELVSVFRKRHDGCNALNHDRVTHALQEGHGVGTRRWR